MKVVLQDTESLSHFSDTASAFWLSFYSVNDAVRHVMCFCSSDVSIASTR